MGYAHDWVSVAGLGKDEVFARLGIVDRGEPVDYPPRGELAWALTPSGRVIVVSHYYWLSPGQIADLSRGASVIAARAEDNDCTSTVWGYEDGRKVWAVSVEAADYERLYDEEIEDGLIVEGDPPREFAVIRDRLVAERDSGEDDSNDSVFMAPLELADTLGGWAPEGQIGQDLQFFRAGGALGAAPPPGQAPGRGAGRGLVTGLAILALVVAAVFMLAS